MLRAWSGCLVSSEVKRRRSEGITIFFKKQNNNKLFIPNNKIFFKNRIMINFLLKLIKLSSKTVTCMENMLHGNLFMKHREIKTIYHIPFFKDFSTPHSKHSMYTKSINMIWRMNESPIQCMGDPIVMPCRSSNASCGTSSSTHTHINLWFGFRSKAPRALATRWKP